MFPWPLLSPRRPRSPSSVSSSSSSSSAPSFSKCPYPEGIVWDCLPTQPTEVHSLLPNLKLFTLKDLKGVTGNFDHNRLVGEGAFGRVYKGWIHEQTFTASKPGSGLVVAVKNLKPETFRGHNEWLMEVNFLGRLNHPNIVKLIGFCSEADNHRLLVYEYVSRCSLDNHLFGKGQSLCWATRMKIAIGVAKGLSFLHGAESQVIHRDLHCSNILLDSEFNAKLSGFGLARAGPTGDSTHVYTRVMGTSGYAAPEYVATSFLSARVDVYSFGVVLLQLLSGCRTFDHAKLGKLSLLDWANLCLNDRRKLSGFMDSKMNGQYSRNEARAMFELALQCLHSDANLRPSMPEVLASLERLKGAESSSY